MQIMRSGCSCCGFRSGSGEGKGGSRWPERVGIGEFERLAVEEADIVGEV